MDLPSRYRVCRLNAMNSETSAKPASTPAPAPAASRHTIESKTRSEDRRRPLAWKPYLVLWACCLSCVFFALISLFIGL